MPNLLDVWPYDLYPEIRPSQKEALEILDRDESSRLFECPTGFGKTAVGFTFLKQGEEGGEAPLFYIAPNKTQVEQVGKLHPEVSIVFGRNEHPCLYYLHNPLITLEEVGRMDEVAKADEVPCSLLQDCPHRVNQETGETHEPGTTPCPYLQQKYIAKRGGIVVGTHAFYLFTQLFSKEWPRPARLVIDEAHRLARVVRDCLSYEITDYYLAQAIRLLASVDKGAAEKLQGFLDAMIAITKTKPSYKPTLLEEVEIRTLIAKLEEIDPDNLWATIQKAVSDGSIDPEAERETLKNLEVLVRDLYRYIRAFEFSLWENTRAPLNYTYAYYTEVREKGKKTQHRLTVKAYYVRPLIQKILGRRTLAYSATIGDAEILGFETGIEAPFSTFPSEFPAANTRIFMPTDTPNLAVKSRKRGEPARVLRHIARTCKRFSGEGIRSLVVVISNAEREKFLKFCREENVQAISYGNGVPPKEAAARFKAGEGNVLVGTTANYGEGIDLPHELAPVIFFLRPGYPRPDDPGTKFEENRFDSLRWRLWNWRVMIEALQVRGRNIRNDTDLGVTFFISQQFRRFVWASLPEYLRQVYQGEKTLEECVEETINLLRR